VHDSVIDAGLIAAVHLHLTSQTGSDDGLSDAVVQVGLMADLLDGAYDGTVELGTVLRHGDLGIGTVDGLDGELVIVDGVAYVVRSNGTVEAVAPTVRTPFAVVTPFRPSTWFSVRNGDRPAFLAAVEEHRGIAPIVALRAHGSVASVALRSVDRQFPPYRPLTDVVAEQHAWVATSVVGTFVGFSFPDELSGVEVGGYHLHFLSDDRLTGGHVMEFEGSDLEVSMAHDHDLGVVTPSLTTLRSALSADRSAIAEVEGR